tara:strand:- start:132 stop:398 length:267 start_codon:yes stop_codon:yes gene_type:complete
VNAKEEEEEESGEEAAAGGKLAAGGFSSLPLPLPLPRTVEQVLAEGNRAVAEETSAFLKFIDFIQKKSGVSAAPMRGECVYFIFSYSV